MDNGESYADGSSSNGRSAGSHLPLGRPPDWGRPTGGRPGGCYCRSEGPGSHSDGPGGGGGDVAAAAAAGGGLAPVEGDDGCS